MKKQITKHEKRIAELLERRDLAIKKVAEMREKRKAKKNQE